MAIVQTLRTKWQAFSYYTGGQSNVRALLRWLMWGIHCLLRLPTVVTIARLGVRLYLLPRWKGCWKAIFVFRERFFEVADPELEFTRRSLKPGDVFVDAGAYHGWYTLVASRAVGERGRVVAFEPNPDAVAILKQNIALNGGHNIRVLDVALSSAEGRAPLYKTRDDGVASSLGQVWGWEGQAQVNVRRLDDVLKELKIHRVDFMKIDVEGSEANLFQGAIETLVASRPTIVFEINPVAARNVGVSERGAWDFLAGLGYRLFRVSAKGLGPLTEFPTVSNPAVFNVVAIYEDSSVERSPVDRPVNAQGRP